MLRRDFAVGVHVIEIGPVFGDDHLKWSPAPRGWKIQHLGQEYRRGLAVVSRQDRVVEMNGHVASLESDQSFSLRRSSLRLFGRYLKRRSRWFQQHFGRRPSQIKRHLSKFVNGWEGFSVTMSRGKKQSL